MAAQVEGFEVDAGHLQLLHADARSWLQERERCQHPRVARAAGARECGNASTDLLYTQTPLGSSSPEAGRRQLRHSHQGPVVPGTSDVGYCVGWCWASRSSFSICISVVFPALSRPWAAGGPVQVVLASRRPSQHSDRARRSRTRNKIFAFLLYRPRELRMP